MSTDRKAKMLGLIDELAEVLFQHICEEERGSHGEKWIPAAKLKRDLGLAFPCVPKAARQRGDKGWLFAILARRLEDQKRVRYKKEGARAFYRTF